MTETYTPPKVWTWDAENGGEWAKLNRPIAGATHDKALPVGEHPLQLYSLATPNGVKVTVMLEELLAAGHAADYDAWMIKIQDGDQFGSGFVDINPNSKIPALMDHDTGSRVFESGAILMYLAEKYGAFLPASGPARTETLNWLFWLQGSAPYLGGGFGHFFAYAPEKFEYPINRFTMEAKRQLDVLNRRLGDKQIPRRRRLLHRRYRHSAMVWPCDPRQRLPRRGRIPCCARIHQHHPLDGRRLVSPRLPARHDREQILGRRRPQLAERHAAADIDAALAKANSNINAPPPYKWGRAPHLPQSTHGDVIHAYLHNACRRPLGLFLGGDWLVRGASQIAARFNVPPLIIGLTIVGFGTSTPELLVSLQAAFDGLPGISIGNVVGSNTANILLILGVAGIIAPPIADFMNMRRDLSGCWVPTLAMPVIIVSGYVGRIEGAALLTGLIVYLGSAFGPCATTRPSALPSDVNLLHATGFTIAGLSPSWSAQTSLWKVRPSSHDTWRIRGHDRPVHRGHRHITARTRHHRCRRHQRAARDRTGQHHRLQHLQHPRDLGADRADHPDPRRRTLP